MKKIDHESLAKIHHVNRPKVRKLLSSFLGGEILDFFPLIWYSILRPVFLVSAYLVFFGWIGLQIYYADRQDFAFLTVALAIVSIMYLLVFLWIGYNRHRFIGKERRLPKEKVTPEEIDQFFHLERPLPESFRNSSHVEFYFDQGDHFRMLEKASGEEVAGRHDPSKYIQPGKRHSG